MCIRDRGAGPVFVVITLVNQVTSSRLAHREGDAELLFAPPVSYTHLSVNY